MTAPLTPARTRSFRSAQARARDVSTTAADELDYAELTPGIRQVVRLLRAHGFDTTDSGDGVTNVEAGMEGALPFPHVHCVVPAGNMVRCAGWARDALEEAAVDVQPGMVQATYDPLSGIAIVSVFHVDDALLAAARREVTP